MAPERRTQAERSEETRAKLLAAALDSLAELGYTRTSTTEIAARAGVSRGAQLHHFPSKSELVAAASRHVMAARVEEFRATLGALPPGPERFAHAIDLLWGIYQGAPASAWHELIIASRTDPELQPVVATLADELRSEVLAVWLEIFPDGIHGLDPELNAQVPALLFAVLDGLKLELSTGSVHAASDATAVLAILKLLAAYFDAVDPFAALPFAPAPTEVAAPSQEA